MQEQPEQEVSTGVKGCSHGTIAIFSSQQLGCMGFHVMAHTHCTGLGTGTGLGLGLELGLGGGKGSTVHIVIQGMV